MLAKTIENHIFETLSGKAQMLALDFVSYLRAQDISFERGTGYWTDKRYWMANYKDAYICFILVNGYDALRHMDEPEGFIIWLDEGDGNWFANALFDDRSRDAAWKNIDFCAYCGSCGGGTRKMILGKEFDNVCRTPFRFDNPKAEDAECVKKLVEIRMAGI